MMSEIKNCVVCGKEYNTLRSTCPQCNDHEYCLDCVHNHRAHPKMVWEVDFFNEQGKQFGPTIYTASKIKPTRWAKQAYDEKTTFTMRNTGLTEAEYEEKDWEQYQQAKQA